MHLYYNYMRMHGMHARLMLNQQFFCLAALYTDEPILCLLSAFTVNECSQCQMML